VQAGKGRAAEPSLFFVFAALLLLLAAALLPGNAYRLGAIVLLALACAPWRALPLNAISAVTVLYCAWLLGSAAFATPAYSAEGIYRPLILMATFASVAILSAESRIQLFRAGVALIAALVLLGLLQYLFGLWRFVDNGQRAAATFTTPNTFATAINLFLLPLAAAYLSGVGSARVLNPLLWLFAGLVASQSRGGMLAFLAGLVFIAWCIGWRALWQHPRRGLVLVAGLAAVWCMVVLAPSLLALFGGPDSAATSSNAGGFDIVAGLSGATRLGLGSPDRLEIYAETLKLIFAHPFSGAGANTFHALFEAVKPESLQSAVYVFAHNDYLQHWLEFGAPGLALLAIVVAVALVLALRAHRLAASDPLPLMCGAALASCFAHAMVDFPLYVPCILMLVGAYLGALAAHLGDTPRAARIMRRGAGAGAAISPTIRWMLALCALAWISQPLLAEVAGRNAFAELLSGRADSALYWQSVARRLEPRNGTQYWKEGVILRDQAVAAQDRALAAKADAIFSQGMIADRYQPSNYLERARTYRLHPELFDAAEAGSKALVLTGKALLLRPRSPAVKAEHVRSLAFAGRTVEARRIVEAMQVHNPESRLARGLALELNFAPPNVRTR